jgi:hypothetical protein
MYRTGTTVTFPTALEDPFNTNACPVTKAVLSHLAVAFAQFCSWGSPTGSIIQAHKQINHLTALCFSLIP